MEQLVQLDPGLIIWTWITFGLVLAILAWKGWGPMINVLVRREERIRNALEAADKAQADAERLEADQDESIRQVRRQAQEILNQARTAAERVSAEVQAEARQRAEELVARGQEQVAAEKTRALREIRTTVVDLSVAMASKVIQRNLTSEDNRRMVEDSLAGLDSMDAAVGDQSGQGQSRSEV